MNEQAIQDGIDKQNTKSNKKRTETSIKSNKLKDEVGMAGSKSTQTRFIRLKHLLYIPTLAF